MKLIHKTNGSKLFALLTAGALGAAPFLTPMVAQADPPSHAPAWGYRDNDRDNRGRGRDDRYDRDGRGRGDRDNRNVTLRGIVVRDLSGDSFTLRADDGRTYRVVARDEPRSLSNGDRVEVRGWIENGTFIAERVNVLDNRGGGWNGGYNGGYGYNQSVDFQGTALRVYSQYRLDVRGDDGRIYQVSSEDNYSSRVSSGDRVRIKGTARGGNDIRADKVQLVDDRNDGYNGGWNGGYNGGWNNGGNRVDFPGRVESSSYDNGVTTLRVRGDNGRVYTVQLRSYTRFRSGERVRVVGTSGNGVVYATSVNR